MSSDENLTKKLRNDFRSSHPVYNFGRLDQISSRLNLPRWWVELVAIEYLPCRRFVEKGKPSVFDFGIFDQSLADTISKYRVVVPSGCILMHNVRPQDMSFRIPAVAVGEYAEPLDKADWIPEGMASKNLYLMTGNSIAVSDPKLGFNWYAIVRDDNRFYQWEVAQLYSINEGYSWFKSKLFDLIPLWNVYMQVYDCQNKISKHEGNENDVRQELVKLYESLEQIRMPLREKILEYHAQKKSSRRKSIVVDQEAPVLTFIDTLRPMPSGYEIESHLESLFYSASLENFSLAEQARYIQKPNLNHEAIMAEIKYSVLCIIMAVTALESYVNHIFIKYLPEESKIFERATPAQKWLYVPQALKLPFRFSPSSSPYDTFLELISWRNAAIHYKPEFTKVKKHKTNQFKGYVSGAYKTFNLENAKRAVICERQMITRISKGGIIPLPRWLGKEK